MFNLKKKLNAFMPGEGARGALQNVLTVEWSGHKTVLVEVPNVAPSRTNEVEMSGMSDRNDYGDYGRLIDDDEDERSFQNSRGHFNKPRQIGQWEDDLPPALPPKPTSYTAQSYQPKPAAHRSQSNNPFSTNRDVRDYEDSRALSTAQHSSAGNLERDLLSFDEPERGWQSFGESKSKAAVDPWAGRGWGTGNGQGQSSPTSSTGTRMSNDQTVEDPFRN